MPVMPGIPERTEAAPYYFKYIERVPDQDVLAVLDRQAAELPKWLETISAEKSLHRYAPNKWTIREVLNHINDGERLFQARAFWFARGFSTELPSFDQDVAIVHAGANDIPWHTHIEEFRAVRQSSLTFFHNLPQSAWLKRGIASDNPFTVRALAYITAGHVEHHLAILRERYF